MSKNPYNIDLRQRAAELRKAGNLSEVLLWQEIKNKKLHGFKFRRQRPIGKYIVDFICKEAMLVVEIDGDSHDGKEKYDEKRDKYLQSLGLKVLHFYDLDVKVNIQSVVHEIKKALPTP